MEARKHGGSRPGAGRKSSAQAALTNSVLDGIVHCAMAQERLLILLRDPSYDPSARELRALALERVRRQLDDAPTAA